MALDKNFATFTQTLSAQVITLKGRQLFLKLVRMAHVPGLTKILIWKYKIDCKLYFLLINPKVN